MEDFNSDGGSALRVTKLKSLNGDVSPLMLTPPPGISRRPRNLRSPHTPIFDPYASSGSSDSPYQDSPPTGFRSRGSRGGALSSIDNIDMPARLLPLLKSPVSIEEDGIVMDGVPVHPSSRTDARRSPSPSWLTGRENSLYLPERSRLGTKGQLAQGKEELCPSPSYKKKDEPCKLSSIGAYTIGSNSRILHHQFNNVPQPSVKESSAPETWPALPTIPPPPVEVTSASTALPALATKVSTDKKGGKDEDYSPSSTGITSEYADWCPLDDGIEAPQTSSSSGKALSREEVNAQIEAALYGPSPRSRLPVFAEFCPEPEELQCLS